MNTRISLFFLVVILLTIGGVVGLPNLVRSPLERRLVRHVWVSGLEERNVVGTGEQVRLRGIIAFAADLTFRSTLLVYHADGNVERNDFSGKWDVQPGPEGSERQICITVRTGDWLCRPAFVNDDGSMTWGGQVFLPDTPEHVDAVIDSLVHGAEAPSDDDDPRQGS